jgi:hypothetical protein
MEPTIQVLLTILGEHPEEPSVLYELGGAYDSAGQEEVALDSPDASDLAGAQ